MFMILTLHFMGGGLAVNILSPSNMNYFFVMPLYFISQAGNTLFFLLSGYYSGGQPRVKSLISLERKAAFYAVSISVIAILSGVNREISWWYVIKSEFPVLMNRYWFISVYVILSCLAPVLIRGLENASKKLVLIIIVVLLLNNTFLYSANMTLMQGLHVFIIGYYLRRFNPFEKFSKWLIMLFYMGSVAAFAAERILIRRLGYEHTTLDEGMRYTLITIMAVLLLSFFAKLNIKSIWPSKISANVLSVYLITVCPAIYHQIYESWLQVDAFCVKWWFIGYYIFVNVLLFSICISIDKFVSIINRTEVKLLANTFRKIKTRFVRNDFF